MSIGRFKLFPFLVSIIFFTFLTLTEFAYSDTGDRYFLSEKTKNCKSSYWGGEDVYGGSIRVIENFHLLATVLGDTPFKTLKGLVPKRWFSFNGTKSVALQPFVIQKLLKITKTGKKIFPKAAHPIGKNLESFLNDPLDGVPFDLTLPFVDPNVALSDQSALLREWDKSDCSRAWHTAVDFDVTKNTKKGFDVVAAADGEILANKEGGHSLVLKHTASNGREFLTLYSHLDPGSKDLVYLAEGEKVERGRKIGEVPDDEVYTHLHFAVAVKGKSKFVNGILVPELWYLIDPFGVYDYRRNKNSQIHYNYLPNNTLEKKAKGVKHAYVWRTDPLIGSLLQLPYCKSFNKNQLKVGYYLNRRGRGAWITDGSDQILSFSNRKEAQKALAIILEYGINTSCFIGWPETSFHYFLRSGTSPRNAYRQENCIRFDARKFMIKKYLGKFRLVSGRANFDFPAMLHAGNGLSVIKKFGFSRVCYVGRLGRSLGYFRK